jgi:hypothetical protein
MKTYVEMGTCLSLLNKIYEPSFLRRCARISRDFDVLFPELKQMSNTLPSLIRTYAYRRLLIERSFLANLSLGKLLTDTLKDLKIMIRYYLRKAYGVDIVWSPINTYTPDDCIKKLNTIVLEDLFSYAIKRRTGIRSKEIGQFAIKLYLRYTLIRFFIAARKKGYRIKWRVLFMHNENIMMKLWMTGFTLLESVKEDLKIDEHALYAGVSKLREILDPGFINMCLSIKNLESKFSCLQKMTLEILDIADRTFHRKD